MKITKKQWQWIFYDWANSGYGILIVTAVFPVYFKAAASLNGISNANSTAYWGYVNSIGTLIVSLLAPFLGALADYPHAKKRWLNVFTWLGIVLSLGLAFIPTNWWQLLAIVYILSEIGYSGGNLFYDSFLTDVADDQNMDRVSSTGYGMGYLGGVLAFIIFLIAELTNGFNGLLDDYGIAKFSFIIAAVWWIIFAWPLLAHGEQIYSVEATAHPFRDTLIRLKHTISNIRHYKRIVLFLIAYFFYIDGVDTIFTMATSIGKDIGIKTTELMLVLLMVQLIAFPCSLLYGKIADRFSTRTGIITGIIIYIVICLYAFFLKSSLDYWILAVLIGTSQGGIQALSRSYFGKLVPKESSSEFFGFYNILGKFSAIIGPLLVGIVTQWTGKSTIGAGCLSFLFLISLIIFLRMPKEKQNK